MLVRNMSQTNGELLHGKEIFMHEKAELEKFKGDLEKKNADINIFMADFNDKNENFEIQMQTFVNAEAMMKSTMMAFEHDQQDFHQDKNENDKENNTRLIELKLQMETFEQHKDDQMAELKAVARQNNEMKLIMEGERKGLGDAQFRLEAEMTQIQGERDGLQIQMQSIQIESANIK